jgi:excinuclease UvrABC ATPase subunit
MAEKGGVYVLDEPTTGLHLADVEQLLGLLDRLVDAGKSVIVIEHHQAVMAHADWIIDLGPGAGHDGGRVVFEGTPADLVAAQSTLTGSTSRSMWRCPPACERRRAYAARPGPRGIRCGRTQTVS